VPVVIKKEVQMNNTNSILYMTSPYRWVAIINQKAKAPPFPLELYSAGDPACWIGDFPKLARVGQVIDEITVNGRKSTVIGLRNNYRRWLGL
jgi:hypothetical protein